VNRLVYLHGRSTAKGGWFNEPPLLEIRTPDLLWQPVGRLEDYRDGRNLKPGQAFELKLERPIEIIGLRISGKSFDYASCAELAAFLD
jgi:hypothetical protein